MPHQAGSQAAEFLVMLLAGALMAALSGIFAGLRRLMRAGLLLSLLCDALMGALWAAAACAALVLTCLGEARGYHFLAMLCGACLFRAAVYLPLAGAYGRCAARVKRGICLLMSTRFCRRLLR